MIYVAGYLPPGIASFPTYGRGFPAATLAPAGYYYPGMELLHLASWYPEPHIGFWVRRRGRGGLAPPLPSPAQHCGPTWLYPPGVMVTRLVDHDFWLECSSLGAPSLCKGKGMVFVKNCMVMLTPIENKETNS